MAIMHVLVTGASTGIGEATARHLDEQGHRVWAGVRKDSDGEALRQGSSDRLTPVQLDVTDQAQIDAVADQIAEAAGSAGLGGLVNNAGIARGGPLEYLPLDDWREQLEVNVVAQVAVTRALLPLLRAGKGRVVFVGSISGRIATPLMGPYSASKHAIEAIGESLRFELAPAGITVSVVEPGAIKTAIWQKGRETTAELRNRLPAEAFERYGAFVDAVEHGIEESDAKGIEAVEVAKAIDHALTAKRPKHRYLVGTDAKAGAHITRMLPDRLRAAFIRKAASGP